MACPRNMFFHCFATPFFTPNSPRREPPAFLPVWHCRSWPCRDMLFLQHQCLACQDASIISNSHFRPFIVVIYCPSMPCILFLAVYPTLFPFWVLLGDPETNITDCINQSAVFQLLVRFTQYVLGGWKILEKRCSSVYFHNAPLDHSSNFCVALCKSTASL